MKFCFREPLLTTTNKEPVFSPRLPSYAAAHKGDKLFGYIRPLKPELKIKDYETYRSVYCGLCKELGRVFGPLSRLTLNYDFTFLALLKLAVGDEQPCSKRETCLLHPFSKRICCQSGEALRLTACAAMLMIHYKNEDNYRDGGPFARLASLLFRPFLAHARRKAARLYPALDDVMSNMMNRQAQLEKDRCDSVDRAADPTAQALSSICEMLSGDERERRVLARFGYLLGRWIYFIDALDDLGEDYKQGGYNPFLLAASPAALDEDTIAAIRREATSSLNLTHGELTKAYQLLQLHRHAEILENIVFLGLPGTLALVNSSKEGLST
ncbi:MAG: DUF5685 family protein [Acetanaerobacterium sp.]